jgi:nicotinamidase-related amidase
VLVVVDMQNDFVRVGVPLEVPDARATIPAQRRLIDVFRVVDRPVIFTRFLSGPKPTLMWNWSPVMAPPVCCCWPGFRRAYGDAEGELECTAVIDELAPLPGEPQVEKYGYNAFHRMNLTDVLRAHAADTVVLTARLPRSASRTPRAERSTRASRPSWSPTPSRPSTRSSTATRSGTSR